MLENTKGTLKFVGLILGWLILFVIVPPLAVFLFFVPMMMGPSLDARRGLMKKREAFERDLLANGIEFDRELVYEDSVQTNQYRIELEVQLEEAEARVRIESQLRELGTEFSEGMPLGDLEDLLAASQIAERMKDIKRIDLVRQRLESTGR